MMWRFLLFGLLVVQIGIVFSAKTRTPLRRQPLTRGRRVLVFGGNGFLGSNTMERFIMNGDNITMINRGNWYWDSFNRVKPYVQHFSCDRQNGIDSCEDLVEFVKSVDVFDAVIDFSAYDGKQAKDAVVMLNGKVKLYILISTDSIYDVCVKDHDGLTKETDGQRPKDPVEQAQLALIHQYGHQKLQAEEEIVNLRKDYGLPYVILRLPDVIGPRDNTHRWWIYQLWVKLESKLDMKPVTIPSFLKDYHMSLVYSSDVSKLIYELLQMDESVYDEIYNLAFPETYTLEELLHMIQKELDVNKLDIEEIKNHTQTIYLYPSVRKGPLDVSKAQEILEWEPTPFKKAVDETIAFYEEAMKGNKFETQKDEIIQALSHHLYYEHKNKFYETLESVYGINLNHFKPKEEL